MAGRRRRGVAAAGAANLLTELINRDMEFSRDSRRRAVELQQKLHVGQLLQAERAQQEHALRTSLAEQEFRHRDALAQKEFQHRTDEIERRGQLEGALQRDRYIFEGKGTVDPQTNQWVPRAFETPTIPSGLEPSGLSYDDPSGVKRNYARPLQEPRAQMQNPASLASAMKTLQDIELMNREEQRQATPGSKGFLGMGRRPAYTPNVIDTGPLKQQLYGGVTQSSGGAGGGGLPTDLPQPTDPSLGDQSGNTEGAQVQSAEDGQVYEVRNGTWVIAQ